MIEETRAEDIDPALKAAGWGVVEGSRVLREHCITEQVRKVFVGFQRLLYADRRQFIGSGIGAGPFGGSGCGPSGGLGSGGGCVAMRVER
jgi:delta 1-pyrroline-5-carboxylate dehydrogenase